MATQEQVNELMQCFAKARPTQMNARQPQRAVSGSEGMLGVLIYLYRSEGTVTAGMISKFMHITTGRVSVLLRKMEEKGLIVRQTGADDARVTEVRMTDKGRRVIKDIETRRNDQMKKLIDTLGMDRLRDYINTSQVVWSILTPLSPDFNS